MRRRYDPQPQRMIFTTCRPNKKSREEIAEIDAELTQRTNQIGGDTDQYKTKKKKSRKHRKKNDCCPNKIQYGSVDTEEDSVILRGDNLPIVDLKNTTQKAGSPLHSKKPHSRKAHRKQENDGGDHKEGGL